jgi:hypothetical protein
LNIRTLPWAVIATLALLGCATDGDWHWERQGASSQEFHMDSGQCRAQAMSLYGPPIQKAIVFTSCMEGKGWYRVANR